MAEINSGGVWTRGYVYLGGQMVAIQYAGANWVHQDPITKSQRVTNSAGTVTSTIDLDPWGGETNRSSNQAFQPHRYTSYERDSNGGDEAMFRRYQVAWTRFSQPDPYDGRYDLTDPQSFNRYAYVQNDPVNFVDPTGLYEACVHEAMTAFLAKLAGLSDQVATRLGELAGEKRGGADSWEYSALNPKNIAKAQVGRGPTVDVHFASEAKLQSGIANFPTYMAMPNGQGYQQAAFVLHSIQDVHGAHQGFGPRTGHARARNNPDRIIGDSKFWRVANETFQVLSGNMNASPSSNQINELIDAIVKGCGPMANKLQITRPVPDGRVGPGRGGGGGGAIGGGGGGGGGSDGFRWLIAWWEAYQREWEARQPPRIG